MDGNPPGMLFSYITNTPYFLICLAPHSEAYFKMSGKCGTPHIFLNNLIRLAMKIFAAVA